MEQSYPCVTDHHQRSTPCNFLARPTGRAMAETSTRSRGGGANKHVHWQIQKLRGGHEAKVKIVLNLSDKFLRTFLVFPCQHAHEHVMVLQWVLKGYWMGI